MNAKRTDLAIALLAAALLCLSTGSAQRRARRPVKAPAKPAAKKDDKQKKEKKEPKRLAILNARIHTGTGILIPRATLLLKDDKIEAVGADVYVPEKAKTFDAKGMHLCPGIVALQLGSLGLSGRAKSYADVLNPYDYRMPYALAAGITSSIAGRSTSSNCVIKMTYGELKGMLLAEGTRVGLRDSTFSSTSRSSREQVRKMVAAFLKWKGEYRAYRAKVRSGDKKAKEPKAAKTIAPLVAAFKGDARLWIEGASRKKEIAGVLDFLDQVNLPAVFNFPTEGWILASRLGRAGCMAVVAPRVFRPRREKAMEPNGSNIRIAAILAEAGVPVACFTAGSRYGGGGIGFSGLMGQDMHTPFNEPAFAVRGGLDEQAAIASVTRVPAIMAGVEHRVGTLEPGKDADFILLNGHPLHYQALVERSYINGKCYYDRKKSPIYKDVPAKRQ